MAFLSIPVQKEFCLYGFFSAQTKFLIFCEELNIKVCSVVSSVIKAVLWNRNCRYRNLLPY